MLQSPDKLNLKDALIQLSEGKITKLDLGNEFLDDAKVAQLATALQENTSLTSLNLFNNNITMGVSFFDLSGTLKVNKTLTSLNLNHNPIADEGVARLGLALKVNTTLTNLDLSNSLIGDTGVKHFAESLKSNKTLTAFNFSTTQITPDGAGNLDALVLSNKNILVAEYPHRSKEAGTELAKRAEAALEAANYKKSAFTAKCTVAGLAVGGGAGELLRCYTSLASTYLPNNPIVRYAIPVITAVIFGAAAYCYAKKTQETSTTAK